MRSLVSDSQVGGVYEYKSADLVYIVGNLRRQETVSAHGCVTLRPILSTLR